MMDLSVKRTVKVPLMMDLNIEENYGSVRMYLVEHFEVQSIFEAHSNGDKAEIYPTLRSATSAMQFDGIAQFYLQHRTDEKLNEHLHIVHFVNESSANQYLIVVY